ncbi:MAG: OmpA family protein [Christensenellales bacterium]
MMAGMLFVFALILFAAVYQLVDLQQKKTVELQTKEAQLSTQQSLLIDQEAELKDKEELLAATTLALQQQQQELDENRTALTSAQESLSLQQSKIEEQAALLAAQQAQIDKLVGLRSQIIEDLRDNLSNVGQRVTVDRKTGAVTFESSVLFDTGKNEIKDAGKAALNSCIPVYIHTLLSDEYRDYVGEIIVEGHTDTTGQYLNNLALSQQRALAVATYCLSDEMTGLSDADKETFKSILTANGRADADPIYNADGTVNMDASRRVVIKFRMKDSDMIDQMSAILEGSAQGNNVGRFMKILAILALVATIAGAGAVLYGINTLAPQVVQTAANVTEAQSVADTFDDMVTRLENGTFGGRIFGRTDDLRAEDCAFVTYTVRLQNKGFFPAEWISMELIEPKDGDVLALPDDSRHALAAGSVGDMQLTVLRRTDEEEQADTARTLRVTCYVFGRKIVFDVSVA